MKQLGDGDEKILKSKILNLGTGADTKKGNGCNYLPPQITTETLYFDQFKNFEMVIKTPVSKTDQQSINQIQVLHEW